MQSKVQKAERELEAGERKRTEIEDFSSQQRRTWEKLEEIVAFSVSASNGVTRPEHCAHGAHRPTYVCIYERNIPQHFSQFWQHGPCVAGGSRSAYHVVVTSGVAASLYRIIIPHLGHLFQLFRCVRQSDHGHFWRDVTLIPIPFRSNPALRIVSTSI